MFLLFSYRGLSPDYYYAESVLLSPHCLFLAKILVCVIFQQ